MAKNIYTMIKKSRSSAQSLTEMYIILKAKSSCEKTTSYHKQGRQTLSNALRLS